MNRADPSGMLWQEIVAAIEAAAKIAARVTAKAAAVAAAAAAKSTAGSIIGGSVYRQLPNGLASALTAKSNTLSAVSAGAGSLGKIAGVTGVGLAALDVSVKVYNNFNNDDLSLSRKISDSVVDVGVTAGSIWAAGAIGGSFGTAVPGIGTAVGFVAGVGIGLIIEYTPVVGWVKDGVGCAVDAIGSAANAVGNFFGDLFG